MNVRRLKPSGIVVATTLAFLFGVEAPALGHQVEAVAHHISGSTITKHSIPGNRLVPNTVTGAQVNESTLGTVPRAKSLAPLVWHPLTAFSNGWVDASSEPTNDVRPLGYAIDAQGLVHLRGGLMNSTASTAGTLALTLPPALAAPAGVVYNIPIEASDYKESDLTITGRSVYLYDGDSSATEVERLSYLEGVVYQP